MKKRLLSAALALAMVLTLLPATMLTAFAAEADASSPESGKTTVQYVHGTDYSKPVETGSNPVQDEWTWQYKAADGKTYWASGASLSDGIVVGTSASGVWYASSDITKTTGTVTSLVSTSFTLVGDLTLSNVYTATTLSINTFGRNLTIGSNQLNTVNSITITDTYYTQGWGARGSVSGLSRNVGSYTTGTPATTMSASGLTLSVTGAGVTGGISLTGRGNRVTLTDVDVAGGIKLDGTTAVTTTNANGSTTVTSYPNQTLTINPKTAAPYTKSTVVGTIAVTGNASTVAINGTTATSSAVNVISTSGTVTLSNGSSVGGIIVVSGADRTATSAPAAVTINDATAASYTYTAPSNNTASSSLTVNVQGKVTGAISTEIGTVSLHSANVGDVTVKSGTLNIDGTSGTVGDITLGDDDDATKVALNFSGTGYTVGNIEAGDAAILTIGSNWPAGRVNTFGTIDLADYAGQGIKGGTFGSIASDGTGAAKSAWFSPDLQFMRKTSDNKYAYYGTRELATAIADANTDAATNNQICVVGYLANGATGKQAEFYNSMLDVTTNTAPVAKLTYGASTAIYLPNMINGTPVATWTDASTVNTPSTGTVKTYGVNELVSLSASSTGIMLVLQGTSAAVTRLTNATAAAPNQNVTVTLSGNQITLSGAVGQAAFEDVEVTCATDMIGTNGQPVTFPVVVSFNTTTKAATISTLGITPPPAGVIINTSNNTIQVGDNTYTLSVSGLAKPAPSLKVAGLTGTYGYSSATITGKSIVATVSTSMGNSAKQALIDAITGSGAEFNWTTSPAMRQVVNQAMTTITTDNQLNNWATAAQRAAWNQLNRGKTPSDTDLIGTGYTDVVLEPYLALTVTAYNQSGTMTANLVPSYRVLVVSSDATYQAACANKSGFTPEGYYIAQAGRALGTPITDLTGTTVADVGVTLKLAGVSTTGLTTSTVMHQDSTYAYTTTTAGTYVITHAGKTGLGTVVLNTTAPLVTMEDDNSDPAGSYDTLQAAVDDAEEGYTITVTAAYTGSGVINVTGTARKFDIVTEGMTTITPANNNFTVGVDSTGHQYTVQLQKNVEAVDGNVEVAVASANNGYASSSVSKAKAGDVITITAVPSTGYKVNTITAATNTGAAVTVSATGTLNQYTLTVPANTTKVTVTPTFVVGDNKATFSVNTNATRGTASVYTGTTDGKVEQGKSATVTVIPANGNRTVGLTAYGNNGATAPVSRTGTNSFNVTVPSGATTVTVTPSFDVDNGTPFSDVLSNHWASSYISWAYRNGYTSGKDTQYTYKPADYITRGEVVAMLWKADGSKVVNYANPFKDVPTNYWAYNAVMWAASKGLIDTSTGYFNGTGYINRADTVVILYKQANSPTVYGTSGFADVASNASYAKAVTWARQQGLTNGYGGNTYFRPGYAISRAEMATFLQRAFG